ncbi:hypothetical protein BOTBODRAFT_109705 [Botryobasidium botryosum FD-172 SS1]|uniref:UbiA prenyltransferase n=1 Tax=Botryobasidium botryosum (strain FD-172 SS1) TaxID=930990 RepID=A0A067MFQ2_BOTB1|nr:hypothetical protein BOTBODRAFT_109705 [Botryobasidium botryosum FD-172 SS1]
MPSSPAFLERTATILRASRPPGWCFGPILFGVGVIHSKVTPTTLPDLVGAAIQILTLSLPLCIIVFGLNDVYDYETDTRNPRKVDGEDIAVLPPVYHQGVQRAAWISSVVVMAASLGTRRIENILATSALVLLGWQYSAPPIRFKDIPILDSLSNGTIVFLSWLVGFSFGGESIFSTPPKGYMLLLCGAGLHALGAVMDADSDAAAGQRTIATYLGARRATIFATLT